MEDKKTVTVTVTLDNLTPDEARAVASNMLLYYKYVNFDIRPTEG